MELGDHFVLKNDQHRPTERNSSTVARRSALHIATANVDEVYFSIIWHLIKNTTLFKENIFHTKY
jgi:hypothetical protein